jgi:hypothetical protein
MRVIVANQVVGAGPLLRVVLPLLPPAQQRNQCKARGAFGCARVDAEPGSPWGEARVKLIYAYRFMRVIDFRIVL